jgi:hypothetical protein
MYATERTTDRPVRKVVSQWFGFPAFRIVFQEVTNEYRDNPSHHSYLGFGGRVANVGAQQELGVRT